MKDALSKALASKKVSIVSASVSETFQVKVNSFQNKGVNITSDASLEFIMAMKILFNISDLNGG